MRSGGRGGGPGTRGRRYSSGGDCIEAAPGFIIGVVPVRDSKDPQGPALLFGADVFASFVAAVQAGDLAFATGEQYV